MLRFKVAAVVTAAVALVTVTAPGAQATNIGTQGCTPGYWKNHTSNWQEDPSHYYNAGKLTLAHAHFVTANLPNNDLMLTALSYKGGPGAAGAEQILLRAAAAAWLNAAHEGVGYPLRRYSTDHPIVASVNAAIASGNRESMLTLAKELDADNNLGCPLN
jgi:hypothetical protein